MPAPSAPPSDPAPRPSDPATDAATGPAQATAAPSKVTIEHVARAAGVSRGTVSRVLNGGYASPSSRAKVQDAIASTGYRTNIHARSLASGRSHVYAAVLSEPYGELFDDPTFGRMLQGVGSELVGTDIALNLLFVTTDEERERTLRQLEPSRVDGIILLSPHIDDPLLRELDTAIPTIVCGALDAERPATWTVTIDDHAGGLAGARHLVERGCRRVGIIGGPDAAQGAHRRVAGQIEGLGAAALPGAVGHAPYSSAGGAEVMRTLLAAHPDLDGVLCGSDRQALGAMAVLREVGRTIPGDVRVVGFDDHSLAATATPPLTTIHQPIFDVGATASRLLHTLLGGSPVGSAVLPTHLIVRSST